jgi:hypothetical protein
MATVFELMENIRAFEIDSAAAASVAAAGPEFEKLQKSQMQTGINQAGKRIGRYKSMKYARTKAKFNPLGGTPPDNVDLKFTGAFYRGIKMKVDGIIYSVTSTDSKADHLESKYSKNGSIFGLNDENATTFAQDKVLPIFQAAIEKATGLKFKQGG